MAKEKEICLDTSVLVDFFRKKRKDKTFFFELSQEYDSFCTSVVTEYEIKIGNSTEQKDFWETFFEKLKVLPFDSEVNRIAVEIHDELKSQNKLIEIPDILIAATAIRYGVPLATLNRKHFERIRNLILVTQKTAK